MVEIWGLTKPMCSQKLLRCIYSRSRAYGPTSVQLKQLARIYGNADILNWKYNALLKHWLLNACPSSTSSSFFDSPVELSGSSRVLSGAKPDP